MSRPGQVEAEHLDGVAQPGQPVVGQRPAPWVRSEASTTARSASSSPGSS
jgi:hypothetical protein